MPSRSSKSKAVFRPNLGLFFDRPPLEVPERGLTAANNVRIVNGSLTNQGLGWQKFTQVQLNGPVTLIDNFFLRGGGQILVFGTLKDLYRYDEINDTVAYITPRYETGTVDVTNGSAVITGTGTSWLTSGIKAGDEIFVGAIGQTDPAAAWVEVLTVDSDIQITLTAPYPGSTAATQAYTARVLFLGTVQDYWRTETFPKAQPSDDDLWFATNGGVDYPVRWDGVASQVTLLSALAFRCKELFRFKNMMLYGNLSLDSGEARPFSLRNSAIGAPENVTTLEAAEFVVHDGLDPVNGLVRLGDALVVYGQRTITLVQFFGPPLLFIFRTAVSGIGPLNGRLVADFGDFHEFVGPDAAYRFEGVSLQEVGFQVWREQLRKRAPDRLDLGYSHFDEERGVLIWVLPLTSDPFTDQPDMALLEHYVEDVGPREQVPYTQQNLRATATGFFERLTTLRFSDIATSWAEQSYKWNDQFFQAAFPLNLMGDRDGFIYTMGTTDSFDGAPIESFARFSRRITVNGRNKGVIRRVYPFAEPHEGASYSLGVIVWGAEQAAGALTNLGQFAHDLTHTGNRFVAVRKVARFFEIEFATTGANTVWTLQGYDLDIEPMGER